MTNTVFLLEATKKQAKEQSNHLAMGRPGNVYHKGFALADHHGLVELGKGPRERERATGPFPNLAVRVLDPDAPGYVRLPSAMQCSHGEESNTLV